MIYSLYLSLAISQLFSFLLSIYYICLHFLIGTFRHSRLNLFFFVLGLKSSSRYLFLPNFWIYSVPRRWILTVVPSLLSRIPVDPIYFSPSFFRHQWHKKTNSTWSLRARTHQEFGSDRWWMSTVPMILSPPSQKIIELQFIVTLYLKIIFHYYVLGSFYILKKKIPGCLYTDFTVYLHIYICYICFAT